MRASFAKPAAVHRSHRHAFEPLDDAAAGSAFGAPVPTTSWRFAERACAKVPEP